MIKINLFFCFLSFLFLANKDAEASDELYKKVFGKDFENKKISIDVTLGELTLGSVRVLVSGDKLINISGDDLTKIFHNIIREEKIKSYTFENKDIIPSDLPFKLIYLSSELRLSLEIPSNDLKPRSANVFDDLIPYYSRNASMPALFSFGTNYRVEDLISHNLNQKNSLGVQTDSFMNFKSVAIENQMDYLSSRGSYWHRQNTKLTYDLPNRMQRMELGDVNYPIIGHQQSRSLGGVSFYRDFSLNPYRSIGPTSSFEYDIETRSLVRTFVNNVILKTEYMNPGRYSVKDIPLNNGINKILVEITDDFGKKRILIFNEAGSLDLLAPGLSRYSMAGGHPSTDGGKSKTYEGKDGPFFSGFYQYGIHKYWTAGGYIQSNNNYTLLGTNNIFASSFGNWAFDLVGSKNKFQTGEAVQATYQLNLFGANWYDTHTLTTKLEYRSLWFNEAGDDIKNRYDYITSATYSVPLFEKYNIAFGVDYQNPRVDNIAKYGFNSSATTKIFNSTSVTFSYARSRDENKSWSTQLYFFLNFTFGESSTFVSAFYEKNSETKRLTVINDNGKNLYNLKLSGSVDDNRSNRNGVLDMQYNTTFADFGAREEVINTKGNGTGSRTSLRFLSAFSFVHNGNEAAFSISRPISNSFVIFSPSPNWKGQSFGVQSSGNDNAAKTGFFGEALISGLTPYQYRRLQLDPSRLLPGHTLGQESFVIYPGYRSGHLFVVGKSGLLVLRGIIVDKDRKPQPLKVGFWTSNKGKATPFFTGREGEFFIEGVEPTLGKLQLDDEQFEAFEINLEKRQSGLIDIGNIVLPYKEGRL